LCHAEKLSGAAQDRLREVSGVMGNNPLLDASSAEFTLSDAEGLRTAFHFLEEGIPPELTGSPVQVSPTESQNHVKGENDLRATDM
jgi:hypothetical protein